MVSTTIPKNSNSTVVTFTIINSCFGQIINREEVKQVPVY